MEQKFTRFEDEDPTLMDQYEKKSFEVHLNKVIQWALSPYELSMSSDSG